jgi:hypothetical protein
VSLEPRRPINAPRRGCQRRHTKRNSLADKLRAEAKTLVGLTIEKAFEEGERRTVEANLGPVRYLATLIGAGDQDVFGWFILVVACCSSPLPSCSCWPLLGGDSGAGRRLIDSHPTP